MVVEFNDKFDRADSTDINGANSYTTAVAVTSPPTTIGIKDTYARNEGAGQAVAVQTGTVPLTRDQFVRARVQLETEGANQFVIVGAMAQAGTVDYGIGVQLNFAASSVRTLQLVEGNGAGAAAFATLGPAATVTSDTLTVSSSDLGVPQEIILGVSIVPGGLRLRAWYNEGDPDSPAIDFTWGQDQPGLYPFSTSDFGDWYFAFGAGATAGDLRVLELNGIDQFEAQQRVEGIRQNNSFSLSELRSQVTTRFAGASNTNLTDAGINQEINYTTDEVWQVGTNVFLFQEPIAEFTITRDTEGQATMPPYVESVLRIWRTNERSPAAWHEWGRTTDDRVIIMFNRVREPGSFAAQVHYRRRLERMDADGDLCAIPKEYSEVIVLGTCMRLARDDTAGRYQAYKMEFEQGKRRMIVKENRKRQERKVRVAAMRAKGRIPGQLTPFSTTGI